MRVTPELDTLNTFYICNPAEDSLMETDPVITFTGENYLVVWSDEKYGPSNTFHPFAARVTPAGVVLDSGVKVSTSGGYEYRPNVADDGERSLVVWSGSSNGSYGRFVNREGMPDGDVFQIAPGTASGPNLCFGDSNYLVVWHTGAYPTLELYGRLVSRQGELGDPFPIATGAGCHRWAALAYDGENFLTVWMSGVNNEPETIFGRFIAKDGSLVGDRFPVSSTSAIQRWWPALAFSDSNCLVAWEQGTSRDVYGNVDVTVTGVAEATSGAYVTRLRGVSPNPFARGTSVNYELALAGPVDLTVRDVSGRLVRRLESGYRTPGKYEVRWNATDDRGRRMPAGIYFLRFAAGSEASSHRLTLIR